MCGPEKSWDLESLRKLIAKDAKERQEKSDEAEKKKHLSDVEFVNQNGRGK